MSSSRVDNFLAAPVRPARLGVGAEFVSHAAVQQDDKTVRGLKRSLRRQYGNEEARPDDETPVARAAPDSDEDSRVSHFKAKRVAVATGAGVAVAGRSAAVHPAAAPVAAAAVTTKPVVAAGSEQKPSGVTGKRAVADTTASVSKRSSKRAASVQDSSVSEVAASADAAAAKVSVVAAGGSASAAAPSEATGGAATDAPKKKRHGKRSRMKNIRRDTRPADQRPHYLDGLVKRAAKATPKE